MMSAGRCPAGLVLLLTVTATGGSIRAQDAAALAALALDQGRPWRATELLRPVVADHTRALPATTLLAARAAAAWGGWSIVSRLLAAPTWPDPGTEAAARELLARAALNRRRDTEAVDHLRAALRPDDAPRPNGVRHTLLARAFDRLDQLDSAAIHYRTAASLLPDAADWLRLRAAGVTADSAPRHELYRRVESPVARARIVFTEAAIRHRLGDFAGAAARWQAAGARIDALRARLTRPAADSARASARRDLIALLGTALSTADSRAAIALLDQQPGALTAAEQLVVARRAAAAGDAARAVRGFTAARAGATLTDQDHFRFGMALAQSGRHPEAIAQFDAVRSAAVAGAAAYQRARSILARSGAAAALPALERVPSIAPTDSASAAVALFLAGDLLADSGDLVAARERFRRVAERYPTSAHAARALLEVGTIAYTLDDIPAARGAFQALAEQYPERDEGSAGAYWAGRLDQESGDMAGARARWRTLIAAAPHSYYALAAARRLGEDPWRPADDPPIAPPPDGLRRALARAALLDSLGFEPEQQLELDALAALPDSALPAMITAAGALRAAGHTARATALAQRALARGATPTRGLYRLLFPIPEPGVFAELVAERRLDPWLVAGLIKQESGFNPRARSVADARGLMQVLPAVGTEIARRLGWSEWDPVLLYQPEVSLTLGTLHLKEMTRRYPEPVRFLAAYNAGGTRVARWDTRPRVLADPELYLERIPYIETRNYVRRVLRNAAFYRSLYE